MLTRNRRRRPGDIAAGALILLLWAATAGADRGAPIRIGFVDTVSSTVLGEDRPLNVFLPSGYDGDAERRYPVIYLLDGAVDEDYHHVTGLVRFLWTYELMPRSIVVGIANTDRMRDCTFPTSVAEDEERAPSSGGSANFRRFLETELIPHVERNYRSDGTRTLIGQSLAGLLATEVFLETPELFTNYMIVSPSLWWSHGALLEGLDARLQGWTDESTTVYVALGEEGDEMQMYTDRLVQGLQKHGPAGVRLHFEPFPAETHATILHRALYRGFELLYGDEYPGL